MNHNRIRSTPRHMGLELVMTVFIVFGTATASAEQAVGSSLSTSISYPASAPADRAERDSRLAAATADSMPALVLEGSRIESLPKAAISIAVWHEETAWLYDASISLVSDFDLDGYYHRFSVSIDADTSYASAEVYARLYLSYEGGPWNHFATSDVYHIDGDSSYDRFVIETELGEGFPAGYYDVRIELYDAYDDSWQDQIGPYDDDSLSALPLEDGYRDDGIDGHSVELGIAVGTSGIGIALLLAPLLLLLARTVQPGGHPGAHR